MNTKEKKMKKQSGFTLIELLIVIGLLGALTALILPRLTADREEAMGDVCDYNQAGSVRVLTQYNDMFGAYPAGMHNGLEDTTATAVAIEGLPDAQTGHMVTDIADTRLALSADQAASLIAAGITTVASGTGYNITTVAADVNVAAACADDGSNPWLDDGGVEMTFDGIAISDWATATAGRRLHIRHVDAVDIGPFLAIQFDRHEMPVEQPGDLLILKRLAIHDMAPVAGRVTRRKKERLVLPPGLLKGFFAPRIPVHRIVRVL